jgi:hypothetical protein
MAGRVPDGVEAPFLEEEAALTRGNLERQEARFMELLDDLVAKAEQHNATIRVIGSLAFRKKCPDYTHIEYEAERYLTDIDFVAYSKDVAGVQDMFTEIGWRENMNVLRLFGDKRRIFYHPDISLHSDVFLDKLRFCHEIDFRGRLELDSPTVPVVDLLLEKLQIVEINRKDLIDVMALLCQHEIGEDPGATDSIDGSRVAQLCGRDWGWWRTATMNIRRSRDFAAGFLSGEEAQRVEGRLKTLSDMIAAAPKSTGWKLRSLVGDRMRWYREVEEVDRD